MHPSIDISVLNDAHLKLLGPLIVGRAGWHAILTANNAQVPLDWKSFRNIVEQEFGLT